jgi:competence protein ComEC
MKWLLFPFLLLANWYYTPLESPSKPVEIDRVRMNLQEGEMALSFFYLSDGQAALIQHPSGVNALINTGGKKSGTELRNLLRLYNISNIDRIILTEHADHGHRLLRLVHDYGVKQVIAAGSILDSVQTIANSNPNVDVHILEQGERVEVVPGAMLEALEEKLGLDVSLTFLNKRMVWMDAHQQQERHWLNQSQDETTIIKAPDSCEPSLTVQLIEKLDPQIAILFPQKNKKITSELLEPFLNAWVRVYYNDGPGAVTIKFTEDNYEIFRINDGKK